MGCQKKIVYAARDLMGVKPFYYYSSENEFLFASEVRALLKGGVPRLLSNEGFISYLHYGSVQEPYSLIKGVFSFKPGHYYIIDTNQIVEHQYWKPSFTNLCQYSQEEVECKVRTLLEDSIRMQMMSDVPLGAFLSGGIDSSAIVSIMRRVYPHADLHTFSIIFEDPKYDERKYSRKVSERNNTIHKELLMSGNIVREFLPDFVNSYDQPSMDGVNTWFVSKLVKEQELKVALSGVGSDELFIGYNGLKKPLMVNSYSNLLSWIPKSLGKILLTLDNKKIHNLGTLIANTNNPYFICRQILEDVRIKNIISDNILCDMNAWFHESYDCILTDDFCDDLSCLSWLEQRTYMRNTLLRDTDQMSMAHSLEIRVPLIDYRISEFVTSISKELKTDKQISKHLLVKAAGDGIPEEVVTHL